MEVTGYEEQARLAREKESLLANQRLINEQNIRQCLANEIQDEIPRALERWAAKGFPNQCLFARKRKLFTKEDFYGVRLNVIRSVHLAVDGKIYGGQSDVPYPIDYPYSDFKTKEQWERQYSPLYKIFRGVALEDLLASLRAI